MRGKGDEGGAGAEELRGRAERAWKKENSEKKRKEGTCIFLYAISCQPAHRVL